MIKKIRVEQYINFDKSIDIMVYQEEKMVDYYDDCPYESVNEILEKIRQENQDAVIEQFCSGELCTGGWMRWEI